MDRDWSIREMARDLRSPELDIRYRALALLQSAHENGQSIVFVLPVLHRSLEDPQLRIRKDAANLLIRYYVDRQDTATFGKLLGHPVIGARIFVLQCIGKFLSDCDRALERKLRRSVFPFLDMLWDHPFYFPLRPQVIHLLQKLARDGEDIGIFVSRLEKATRSREELPIDAREYHIKSATEALAWCYLYQQDGPALQRIFEGGSNSRKLVAQVLAEAARVMPALSLRPFLRVLVAAQFDPDISVRLRVRNFPFWILSLQDSETLESELQALFDTRRKRFSHGSPEERYAAIRLQPQFANIFLGIAALKASMTKKEDGELLAGETVPRSNRGSGMYATVRARRIF